MEDEVLAMNLIINPATNYVIPAAAERRAGIQQTPNFTGFPPS
ncbi:hypothetical protein D1AOALGA4SA_1470 [Olavius algarvensis Delta 1 endosymbiont]|nr:hypothetical protein D1AOALGA4SA_1470 [Olavius algarvensis Delta 1 endosymbiont]